MNSTLAARMSEPNGPASLCCRMSFVCQQRSILQTLQSEHESVKMTLGEQGYRHACRMRDLRLFMQNLEDRLLNFKS